MELKEKCELCRVREAALHCDADEALLCWKCDEDVHGANFLAARHLRSLLCCRCHRPTHHHVSGSNLLPPSSPRLCASCTSSDCLPSRPSCDQSSRCVSTLKSEICSKERSYERSYMIAGLGEGGGEELRRWYGRKKEKIEGLLRKWCKRLDVTGPSCVVAMAMRVMEKALINTCTLLVRKHTLRIYMVASLFLAAVLTKSRVRISPLKSLQECTGLSSKAIVLGVSKLCKLIT
eukprot:Gb_14937 [translate_table: standard]